MQREFLKIGQPQKTAKDLSINNIYKQLDAKANKMQNRADFLFSSRTKSAGFSKSVGKIYFANTADKKHQL